MKTTTATIIIVLLATSPLGAQVPYNTAPDWTSSDTPYSTGGALVDIDQDGWLDFVVANGNDIRREQLVVYYNNGDGTLPTTPNWLSADDEYNGHLSIADVNGDGWLDVAVGLTMQDEGTSTARLYLNNQGTLSSLPDWTAPDELSAFHVAFGDVNGDGRPDLAVGTGWPYSNPHTWHNYVYLNVNGTLEANASWASDDVWDYMDIFFCDANDDGWLDLVGVGTKTDTWVYVNDGGSLDTAASWHTADGADQYSVMGTYGDVDGDGFEELFLTDNVQLFRLGSLLHWEELLAIVTDPGSRSRGSGNLRRYDGLPGGFFTTTPTWTYYASYGSAVTLADIDADDDLDLATGSWWGNVHCLLNGEGSFPSTPDWSSAQSLVVEAICFGDVNRDGQRWPTESFDVTATPGRHLFQLAHQPIETIRSVSVDGDPLGPDQYTFDPVHGWVSVGPAGSTSVTIQYTYTLKPDMAVTDWSDGGGNYLWYNLNDAMRLGDFDEDGDVDLADFDAFASCFTGPGGGPIDPGCEPGDFDADDDIDCEDFDLFALAWTAPGEPPWLPQCSPAIPTLSEWGLAIMTLLLCTAGALIFRRHRSPGFSTAAGAL